MKIIYKKIKLFIRKIKREIFEYNFNNKSLTYLSKKKLQKIIKRRHDIYHVNSKNADILSNLWNGEIKKLENIRIINNAIPVVLTANEDYSPYLAVMLQSLLDYTNKKKTYHFIVLERGFSIKTKEYLINQVIKFNNCIIDFINISNYIEELKLPSPVFHFSIDVYSRFFIPYLFDKYAKIIYCDSDMLVKADISELFEIDIADNCLAAVKCQITNYYLNKRKYNFFIENTPFYMLFDNWSNIFNGGLLVFNTKLFIEKISYQELFRFIIKYTNTYINHWNDQDILNLIINNEYFKLPSEWNYTWHVPSENSFEYNVSDNQKIIHFTSDVKPWKKIDIIKDNPIVKEYLNYALKIPLFKEKYSGEI